MPLLYTEKNMILEIAVIAGLTIGAERAYKAYKRGTLLADLTNGATTLKADLAAVEAKAQATGVVAKAELEALLASAKLVIGKLL